MNKSTYHSSLISGVATLSFLGAAAGVAQTPPAPAPEKKPRWETTAAAGLSLTQGNSETITATGNVLSQRKWKHSELRLGADVTYGENDGVKSAEAYHAFGQFNWLFSERTYGYLRADALHDDIADIQYRVVLSPGAGYYFIKNPKTQLSAEVGPGVVFEDQGGNETVYFTLRMGERLEHKFDEKTRLWQSAEFLPEVVDWENFIVNVEIGIETMLNSKLSLRLFAQDSYDNEPAPGKEKNDLKLVAQMGYKF